MEADLQHAAIEDRWPVTWPEYEEVNKNAHDAVEKRQFGRALVEFGRLFDILMTAIHQQRKIQRRETKPKKGSSPSMSTVNEKDSTSVPKKTDSEIEPPKV
jgi:hypothetical protein